MKLCQNIRNNTPLSLIDMRKYLHVQKSIQAEYIKKELISIICQILEAGGYRGVQILSEEQFD